MNSQQLFDMIQGELICSIKYECNFIIWKCLPGVIAFTYLGHFLAKPQNMYQWHITAVTKKNEH